MNKLTNNVMSKKFCRSNYYLKKCCIIILLLFLTLHFIIFPLATEFYNDACFLDKKKYQAVVKAIFLVSKLLDKYNQTYWIDYGTLLGYYRSGRVMKHDSDGDLGRLMLNDEINEQEFCNNFEKSLNANGLQMFRNCTRAVYISPEEHVIHIDMFKFRLKEINSKTVTFSNSTNSTNTSILQRMDDKAQYDRDIFLPYSKKMGVGDLPSHYVLPVKTVKFMEGQISAPFSPEKVIKHRYPFSYNMKFPYKWKCWLPWNY